MTETGPRGLDRPGQYGSPELECDLIMKGGITSGVVYPKAACELARRYRFRSIGGTSAGAIAAAACAAAEHGRRDGGDGGFPELAGLPDWLGRDSNLQDLFQPDAPTRGMFDLVSSFITRSDGPGMAVERIVRIVRSLVLAALDGPYSSYPGLGAALVVVPLVPLFMTSSSALAGVPATLLVTLLALLAVIAGSALAVVRTAGRELPRNGYGLVSGCGPGRDGKPPLTVWLHEKINSLAGRGPEDPPLTFGELWDLGEHDRNDADHRRVNLEMQTTCLTLGQPCRLPFELYGRPGTRSPFFWNREEWRRLFPPSVIGWLEKTADWRETDDREQWTGKDERTGDLVEVMPLPAIEDLPVVVVTRMSLSFPILLSAVPLYKVDHSLKTGESVGAGETAPPSAGDGRQPAEHCWFSDGDITSNFPIHFFDSFLPRRPTFGINLRSPHVRHGTTGRDGGVFMPDTNGQGIVAWWARLGEGEGVGRIGEFLMTIFRTLQNWVDNSHLSIPGYRDRIVHVSLEKDEGGMNLDMPPGVISCISERGRRAGALLCEKYADPSRRPGRVGWANHRWIRFRSLLTVLEDMLPRVQRSYAETGDPREPSYRSRLLDLAPCEGSYPLTAGQRDLAFRVLEGTTAPDKVFDPGAGIMEAARAWAAEVERDGFLSLSREAPSRALELRMEPGQGGRRWGGGEGCRT